MKRFTHLTFGRRWCAGVGLLIASVLPGCYERCGGCGGCGGGVGSRLLKDDIPAGAIPVLTGTYTRQIRDYQENLAEQDDFVIYEHEWLLGGTKPGPYGRYHLAQILKRLPEVPFPVLIQAHPDDALNEARRLMVSQFLQTNGILDADTRVIIGFPEPGGLYGSEAVAIYRLGFDPRYGYWGTSGGYGGGYGAFASFGGGYGGNNAFRGIGGGFGGLRR
jgi:hypothetical protein